MAALVLKDIQESLNYVFKEPALLWEALTHRSYFRSSHQVITPHNERLEFLGDAVLGLVVSEHLAAFFPSSTEGELSKIKADLISRATLAKAAGRLCIGRWLRLGRGEEINKGREKSSLLANALEAIIGAVYLDGGLDEVRKLIQRVLAIELTALQDGQLLSGGGDGKSRLQEWTHKHFGVSPSYRLIRESGPDHQKVFAVHVEVSGKIMGRGEGRTKKEAEQQAAAQAITQAGRHRSESAEQAAKLHTQQKKSHD